jgi:hypothetical protein
MGMIFQYAPNRRISHWIVPAGGAYLLMGLNPTSNLVTGYASPAALDAAGGVFEWPALDTYTNLQYIGLRSTSSAGGDGGGFWFVFDKITAPPDDTQAEFVSGGGQFVLLPGPIHNVWIKSTTPGDHVILLGGF